MRASAPLAISPGDPAGVGPELVAQAWLQRREAGLAPFAMIGGASLMRAAAQRRGIAVPVAPIATLAQASAAFADALPVLDHGDCDYAPGAPDPAGARFALAALGEAARLTFAGEAGALVTGPIAKARLAQVGFNHPGQTEFVAAACGVAPEDAVMMLAGPQVRTIPLTVHIALSEVPGRITRDLIVRRAMIAAAALTRDFGIERPRVAVAALNPHAGEDGRMGREDIDVIAPAIADLKAAGIAASGPHPADALFSAHGRASFDVALCMYHDQALIPVKALDFDEGVNVTLGLPIVRTSPDHGTAFAIAGTGKADAGAMIAAIAMAGACAARRAAA